MIAPQPATAPSQADIEQPNPHPRQTSPIIGLRRATRIQPESRTIMLQRSSGHNASSLKRNSKHPSTYLSSSTTTSTTAPPSTSPPSQPPPAPPHRPRPRPDSQALFPLKTFTSFEEPRRAPQPPNRPPRPSSELFLPPAPNSNVKPSRRVSRPTGTGAPSTWMESSLHETQTHTHTAPLREESALRRVVSVRSERMAEEVESPNDAKANSNRSSRVVAPPQYELPAVPMRGPRSQYRYPLRSAAGSALLAADFSHRSYSASTLSLLTKEAPGPPTLFQPATQSAEVAFSVALDVMKTKARQGSTWSDSSDEPGMRPYTVRSNTAPPSLARPGSTLLSGSGHQAKSMRARRSSTVPPHSPGSPLLKAGEKDRWLYRADRAGEVRATLFQLDKSGRVKREMRKDSVSKQERVPTSTQAQSGGKKKRKGETMSMLLDEGFFPVAELVYGNAKVRDNKAAAADIGFRLNLPPRLSFMDKDLPQTPNSVQSTPIEVYQTERAFPTVSRHKVRNRRSGGVQRSPLSLITESDRNGRSEAGNKRKPDHVSPGGGLAAIPEDRAGAENVRPASGATTPVATQIHLRGGSIVTVTPPELTAWKATVYIHGPIFLPKPAIMPRKNSVASLEAFQDAVDTVYQNALSTPRRRSDDAVADDICDFFDEFGFEHISFGGDRLSSAMDLEMEMDEEGETEEVGEASEGFSRAAAQPAGASPVEVVIAKEVLETGRSKQASRTRAGGAGAAVVAPPVETEETLRARGIARLSRASAGSSWSEKESSRAGREGAASGIDEVDELGIDGAGAGVGVDERVSVRNAKSRKAVAKARRLFASTIL